MLLEIERAAGEEQWAPVMRNMCSGAAAPSPPPRGLAGNDLKGARERGQELPGSGNTLFLGLGASDVGLFTL